MLIPLITLAYFVMFLLAVKITGGLNIGDYPFHMEIINRWLNGENPLLDPQNVNGFPYGPYSHILTAFFSKFTGLPPETILACFQVIVYPLVILSLYFLVQQFRGQRFATTTLLLALCGFAFWDRPSQIIPHAIDMILIPIMVYAYLKGRNNLFILSAVSLVYNHLFYSIFPILGLFAHSVAFKKDKRRFAWVALGCLPMAYILSFYWHRILLFPQLNEYFSPQYIRIMLNPMWGVAYLGYPLCVLFIIGLFKFAKRDRDEFAWVTLLWLLAYVPFLLKFPHRALTYMAAPMAIIGAGAFKEHTPRMHTFLFLIFILYFMVQMAFLFAGFRVPVVDMWAYLLIGWTAGG